MNTTTWHRLLGALALMIPLAVAAQQGPIRVGALVSITGVFAPNGLDTLDGFNLYLEEVGAQAGGRKIEVIVEDTVGKPDVALTKARKLVESDKVHVLTGLVTTSEALAVSGYAREKKIPLVISGDAGTNSLTMPGKLLNPYLVRASNSVRDPGAVAGDWAYKQGWRRVALVASDYTGGLEAIGSFARVFCLRGGQVVQEQYPPIGTPDFGPYVTNLERKVDAVILFVPGTDGPRFARQYIEAGLKGKIPLMDIFGQVTVESNLPQFGETGLGILSVLHYTAALKSAENERFVKAFRAKTGRLPTDNGPDGYVGARTIVEAVKALGGKIEDADKFVAVMRQLKFASSPKGPIAYDQYGNVIQSQYVRRVEKVGNEYLNVPIATYDGVSQFWPFNPDEYLKFKYKYPELKGSLTDCKKCLAK